MAQLIKVGGTTQEIEPDNGSDFQLKEMYKLLECDMIQIIDLKDGELMVVDEEGKLNDKTHNSVATDRAAPHLFAGDFIAGHALVCKRDQLR